MAKDAKYIVAYMGGTENEGITDDWVAFDNIIEASNYVQNLGDDHGFWKASICKIEETYES